MTPSGIEPATFWPVALYLNQLRHRVPTGIHSSKIILMIFIVVRRMQITKPKRRIRMISLHTAEEAATSGIG
jgi:hypothetical protein